MTITVVKRDGSVEDFQTDKIETHVQLSCKDLEGVDPEELLSDVFKQCHNGMTTTSIQNLLITTAAEKIDLKRPNWSYVAARATLQNIYKDVTKGSFRYPSLRSYLKKGVKENILDKSLLKKFDLSRLDDAVRPERDDQFQYLGILTLLDRYLVRSRLDNKVLELPQHFWMRVSMGLALSEKEDVRTDIAIELYNIISTFEYVPSTPTLFNSGTLYPQLSSCFLTSKGDDTYAINDTNYECSVYSKFAGGVAIDMSPLRCAGSIISSTRGESSGIVPYAHIANGIANAFDQSGKRKGAIALYLADWHGDIDAFLDLKEPTGDFRRRAPDVFPAIWHSDEFMRRAQTEGAMWSLFSPHKMRELLTLYGEEFDKAYREAEEQGLYVAQVPADELWKKMTRKRFGHGVYFACFKDTINKRRMQLDGVVRSSNLCTEIVLNTNPSDQADAISAVCNLGSVNLAKVCPIKNPERFKHVVRLAVRALNNVVDFSLIPHQRGKKFNEKEGAIGLGIMGYAEWLAEHGIDFESQEHLQIANTLSKAFSYYAIDASADLAQERGSYKAFEHSRWARGELPKDTAYQSAKDLLEPGTTFDYDLLGMDEAALRRKVASGMRNSHIMAIAPTATIANIVGTTECTQLPYKLSYTKDNLSGTFKVLAPTLNYPAKRYLTAREVDQVQVIKAAAVRQIWIDQSQSTNLYLPVDRQVKGSEISDWYFLAWSLALKTLYYLKGVSSDERKDKVEPEVSTEPKLCSLDNPECESCQ